MRWMFVVFLIVLSGCASFDGVDGRTHASPKIIRSKNFTF